jgi:hypothetical protein
MLKSSAAQPISLSCCFAAQCRFTNIGEQNVARLHVAVQDAEPMGGLECPGDSGPDPQHVVHRKWTLFPDPRLQRVQGVVRHDQIGPPAAGDTASSMVAMLGCPVSRPIARCSRTNRARLSSANSPVSTITATVRSNRTCRQR